MVMLALQGMGEGEGKKDVSDQLENEDQLLGAQRPDQKEEQVLYSVRLPAAVSFS